jgi:glyoxylase-like metal-dependent hydrolase (beta-lactamase superfamily II)
MFELSRRDLILSASTAALALGVAKPFVFLGASPAAAATMEEQGFHKFMVGDVEVTALFDGAWGKDHDPNFIKGVTVEETQKALAEAGLPTDKVTIPFSVMVAKVGGKHIMFDAGTGGQLAPTAGLMAQKNMAAAGIDAAAISTIAVTHFHPDHIFGCMAKDTNAQLFPNAEIVVPAAEFKFWTDAGMIAKLPKQAQGIAARVGETFAKWKNVRQVEAEAEVVPGIRAIATPGHTPGHTSYQLSAGGKVLYVLGDVSNIPALFLKHPNWHIAFDADGDLAEKNRRAIMDRVIAEGAMIAGYHYPFPAAGTVQKDGEGYAFVPAA